MAVDDNADSRALLRVILKLSSADEAAVVSSGREALRAIKNVHPDVLICDLAMPEMDGYELLENVRRLEPELGCVSAIAFTAAAGNTFIADLANFDSFWSVCLSSSSVV